MFQQPAENTGEKVPMAELVGSLVLITVREVRQGITTQFGEKEAVACDVHVLQGAHAGDEYENALIFQGALIGALKHAAGGDPVLGRVGLGVKKPGQNAPYVLNPFSEQDAQIATAWIASRMQQPAPAGPQTAAAATPAAAANPSQTTPAAQSVLPASGNTPAGMDPAVFAGLPPEVQELLKQQAAA
jgi:hypothetical protein